MGLLNQLAGLFRSTKAPPRARISRAPRHATSGFSCRLGEVLDMSGSGMRVRSDAKPDLSSGGIIEVTVTTPLQRCTLKMRLAWCRKIEEHWQMGFEFIDVGPALAESLESLARYGCAPLEEPGARRGRSTADERAARERDRAGASGAASPAPMIEASVRCMDLYALLDVSPDADQAEIKSAYRRAARILHPDVNKTPEATEQFTIIRKAYSILGDEAKRARYDELRRKAA